MKFTIVFLAILFGFNQEPDVDKYQYRFDDESLTRVVKLFPYIKQASYNTDIDPVLGASIIYTETNARNLMGDNGNSYGLGQIRCASDFSWVNYLEDRLSVRACNDLMDKEQNVYSVFEILSYLKNRFNIKSKNALASAYNLGYAGRNYDYSNKVDEFYEVFKPHYRKYKYLWRIHVL